VELSGIAAKQAAKDEPPARSRHKDIQIQRSGKILRL
jgi:hypothetical protein